MAREVKRMIDGVEGLIVSDALSIFPLKIIDRE